MGRTYLTSAFATSLIYSGVVPQQPPTIPAPASTSALMCAANSAAFMEYTAFPLSSINGIPAFGFAITGMDTFSLILRITETSWSGPTEQLTPTASAPYFQRRKRNRGCCFPGSCRCRCRRRQLLRWPRPAGLCYPQY